MKGLNPDQWIKQSGNNFRSLRRSGHMVHVALNSSKCSLHCPYSPMGQTAVSALEKGVAVSTAVDLHKRVIGGAVCPDNDRLYHVTLIGSNGNENNFCGGSLISDSWILTAAHCWPPGWTLKAILGVHPGQNPEEVLITQAETFVDEHGEHDIMLLKFAVPTNFPHATLPNANNCQHPLPPGAVVQIAGHGSAVRGRHYIRVKVESANLQCANIEVVDCQRLEDLRRLRYDLYYGAFFCGRTPGVDISPGDSGGGVVYNGNIYGVISFSGDAIHADREPAGFLSVCSYLPWIRQFVP